MGIFGSFALVKTGILLIGMITILSHSGTFATGGPLCGGRDNSQFLTGTFRDSTPNDAKVICALFGDGSGGTNSTAYTSGRATMTCATGSMTVTGISPGTDQLPTTLGDNTIYVLESGNYTMTAERSLGKCTAIVGKGTVAIQANYATDTRLLASNSESNIILDNFKLDRNRGTNTGTNMDVVSISGTTSTTMNTIQAYSGYMGINMSNGSNYVTINNGIIYTNASIGIQFHNSTNGQINNTQSYSNVAHGIYLYKSTSSQINNSQSYNNTAMGIYLYTTINGVINNSQAYNNTTQGIYYNVSSTGGQINDSLIYSNGSYGTVFNNSNNGQINNSQIYSNNSKGIYYVSSNSGQVNNSRSYNNNDNGIEFYGSISGQINNSQSYNNKSYGIIYQQNSTNGQINNSQSYNNTGVGIYYALSINGQLNNSQSYSNKSYGVYLYNGATSFVINNSQIHHNASNGIRYEISANGQVNNSEIYNNANVGVVYYNAATNGQINNSQIHDNTSYGIVVQTANNVQVSGSQIYSNNGIGILYIATATSGQINNSQVYNNASYGICYQSSNAGQINNSQSYNNASYGMLYYISANYGVINNSQSYNNNSHGIAFYATSHYGAVNNSQSYNNIGDGILYFGASDSGAINNSQFYNNAGQGIDYSTGANNVVNNSWSYNNAGYGVNIVAGSTNNKFYGDMKLTNINGVTANFITGTDGLAGRSNGTIELAPSVSRDRMINPRNLSGNDMFAWTATMSSLSGRKTTFTYTSGMQYSYGSGMLTQIQPVFYNGTTLVAGFTFDATKFIGSSLVKVTGDILGINTYNGVNSTVTGTSSSPVTQYNIYGNVVNSITGVSINTATGIQLTAGTTIKTIITQFYDPTNYFAMHFQRTTILDTTVPSIPTLILPITGSGSTSSSRDLLRSGAVDTGIGISGYAYQVSNNSGFTSFVISGTTTTTGVSLIGFTDGTYYRRISAVDLGGTTGGRSTIWNFVVDTTMPVINFTGVNPDDNAWINANSFTGQLDITELNLSQFKRTRNTTDYSIYDSGLVFMMNMDRVSALSETDGLIRDLSQYGNNGSGYGGVTWTTNGARNGGYLFDGVNDYISAPATANLEFGTGAFTVMLRTKSDAGCGRGIIDKGGNFAATSTGRSLNYACTPQQPYILMASGTVYALWNVGLASWTGWKMVGLMRQTNGNVYFINDGILTLKGSFVGNVSNPAAPLKIGKGTYAGVSLSGAVDEVRIYNRALTAGEVSTLYYSNLNKYDTNKWNFTISQQGITTDGAYRYTGYVSDLAGNTTTTGRTINRDATVPTTPVLLSPTNAAVTASSTVNLLRSGSIDTGVGMSGYIRQISTGSAFTSILTSGSVSTTGATITGLTETTYYRRVYGFDTLGNTGGRSTSSNFVINTIECATRWDNTNLITGAFWTNGTPTNDNIICALYGTGIGDTTAYTQPWNARDTTQCSGGQMVVTGRSAGTDQLPVSLVANTIYVLESGNYTMTAERALGKCTAIIGKGTVVIQANYATDTYLLSSTSKSNIILDNLRLDRNRGANTGVNMTVVYLNATTSSTFNMLQTYSGSHGIYANVGSSYVTINNSQTYNNAGVGIAYGTTSYSGQVNNTQSYNNTSAGIYFGANYGQVNNSQSYNNASNGIYFSSAISGQINNSQSYNNANHGLYFLSSPGGQINNSQSYNNTGIQIFYYVSDDGQINNSQSYDGPSYGIDINTSLRVTINNSQIYNFDSFGIIYENSSNSGAINNCQIYNNGSYGIYYNSGSDNAVNNSQVYNNASYGMYTNVSNTSNRYYGDLKVFGNSAAGIGGPFTTGTDGLAGRSNGTLDLSPAMTRDRITNPRNLSTNDMLAWTGTMASLRGRKTAFTFTTGMQYSYGSGILTQIQPVVYNGNTLAAGGTFDTTQFIGSSVTKVTGDLLGINTYNGVNTTVTGTSSSPVTQYNIYGNVVNPITGVSINTATGIQLTAGSATNTIITQFYDPTNYFAMHFQRTTILDTTVPSIPTLILPITGSGSTSSSRDLLRSGAVDTGIGISGYTYQVSNNSGFTSFVISGTTTTTGVSLIGFTDGTYYRRISAVDLGGTTGGRSTIWNFFVDTITPVINFTGVNPADNAWININSFTGQLDITELNLNQFKRTRSGVDYSIYDSGLVLMMNFDKVAALGDTDANILDTSVSANHASGYNGVARTSAGRWNGGYVFDGINDYMLTKSNLSLGNTFSVGAWVKASGTGAYIRILETRYDVGFYIGLDAAGTSYQLIVKNNTPPYGDVVGGTVQLNTRQYVFATYNGTTGCLYVNGVLVDSGAFTAPGNTSYPVYIGKYYGVGYNWKGSMDEVRIYNRALTAGEISTLYYSNLNKYDTNKWNFTILQTGITVDGAYRYTGYVSDLAGNTTTTGRTINRDTTVPTTPVLLSPTSGTWFNTGTVSLLRSGAIDTGGGISGYVYQLSTGSTFTTIYNSGSVSTTGATLTGLPNNSTTYYRRVYAFDILNNTGGRSTGWNFIVDTTTPVLNFTGVNPADNAWINANYFTGQLDLNELNLNQFKRTRSGVDYSLYDSGLVLMMNFDKVATLGETGGFVKDFSQYGNDGTIYGGATWTGDGRWNGGYYFDGNADGINVGDRSNLNLTGAGTVSFWIKIPTARNGDTYPNIVSKGANAGWDTNGWSVFVFSGTSNQIGFGHRSGALVQSPVFGNTIKDQWTNITLTFGGSGTAIIMYQNAVVKFSAAQTFNNPTTTTNVFVGRDAGGQDFGGSIDEVRIRNRALTTAEVSTLYYSNLNKYATGRWNFTILQTGITVDQAYRYTGYVSDFAGNTTTTGRTINRDATVPTFTFADNSGPECSAGTLSISSATDTGIGLHSTPYSFDGSTRNTTTDTSILAQQPGTQTRTGRVKDQLENTTTHTATYTFTDTVPTANNFTGQANVGNINRTGDWKSLSSASEGSCGNTDIVYSGIVIQGTKGSCSVVGNIITYIPATNKTGNDSCTISIKDNENSTTNIIVYRGNIDTTAPTASINYSITGVTNQNVTATLTGYSENITITNNGGSSTYLFTGNGSFQFTFVDGVGNTGAITASVNRINFTFISLTGISYNTLYTSNIVTVQGFGPGVNTGVSITTGTLYKNGVALGGLSTTGTDGDQFYIGLTSAGLPSTTRSSTMQIGSATGVYSITTIAMTFTIQSPTALDVGNFPTPETTQTVEKLFPGTDKYFILSDYIGDDVGYYTTLSMGNMTDTNGDILSNTNIAIKTIAGIVTLSGSANPNVTSGITGSYITFGNSVLTFIKRDPGANGGLTGAYATSPALEVTIPQLQNMGDYSGTMIYTLYPN